jgi:hypothetical protein
MMDICCAPFLAGLAPAMVGLLENMDGASPAPAQIVAPRSGEIKRAAMKRGGSATIAPKNDGSATPPIRTIMGAGVAAGPHCPFAET